MCSKISEIPESERKLIVKWRNKGKTYDEISKLVNIYKSTIHYILKKSKFEGTVKNKYWLGRPKKLTEREERALISEIKKNPKISATKLAMIVKENFKKDVNLELCRRVLRENDYHARVPRKKPYISNINKKKRLKFAKEFISQDNAFWNEVIFSDKSKFNVFGSDAVLFGDKQIEMEVKNLCATVKHGGGSIMIWGCMAASGTGNLVYRRNNG